MKTASDPRHKKRQKLVEELFRSDFLEQSVTEEAHTIIDKLSQIDEKIQKAAPEFPIRKINKIDLAILRLAVFELVNKRKEPPKVIIDEAIELAKEYAGETGPSFVNGVLGNIVSHEKSTNI